MKESVNYNTRIRLYNDGTAQVYFASRQYHRAGETEKENLRLFKEYALAHEYGCDSLDDMPYWFWEAVKAPFLDDVSKSDSESENKRKKVDHMKRAIQQVYNIAKNNSWDYFVTFTFNPAEVDSFDYDSCVGALKLWMNSNRQRGIKWLIVPEQHKSGRYHFHALVAGPLKLVQAVNPHTGLMMLDKSGRPVYNVGNYKWGHTTATEIGDAKRTANYISKYLAKEISVPKGRKRYWFSYGLDKPDEVLTNMDIQKFCQFVPDSIYYKDCSNEYGNFYLLEVDKSDSLCYALEND